MQKKDLYIQGMHGLGDNLHQRAILRSLREDHNIYLETSWPQVYWDMPELKFLCKGTTLRTQLKNSKKNQDQFYTGPVPQCRRVQICYRPDMVRQENSVLKAMAKYAGCEPDRLDYGFSVRPEWLEEAEKKIFDLGITKPIAIFRPLNERKEWSGCANRNPDYDAYARIFTALKDKFHVISIADAEPEREWIVGHDIQADTEFHKGELSFEMIAALVEISAFVYSSPGFAIVLARALKKPAICIFGGYENSASFSVGKGPYLGIDPINSCQCFSHTHKCDKRIDIPIAIKRIKDFLNESRSGGY